MGHNDVAQLDNFKSSTWQQRQRAPIHRQTMSLTGPRQAAIWKIPSPPPELAAWFSSQVQNYCRPTAGTGLAVLYLNSNWP